MRGKELPLVRDVGTAADRATSCCAEGQPVLGNVAELAWKGSLKALPPDSSAKVGDALRAGAGHQQDALLRHLHEHTRKWWPGARHTTAC